MRQSIKSTWLSAQQITDTQKILDKQEQYSEWVLCETYVVGSMKYFLDEYVLMDIGGFRCGAQAPG